MGKSTFSVYVVELDPAAACRPATKGPVYVGETSLTPEERFARHKSRPLVAARIVRKHGVRLRPDLVVGPRTFQTRAAALRGEARLAKRLRNRGYEVFGGQGRTFGSRKSGAELTNYEAGRRVPI